MHTVGNIIRFISILLYVSFQSNGQAVRFHRLSISSYVYSILHLLLQLAFGYLRF